MSRTLARLWKAGAATLIAAALVLALGAPTAGAHAFVSLSLSRYLIDLDNPAQVDHLKITSSANGLRIRFEDPEGITISPDLEPGSCDPAGANAAECNFGSLRNAVSVKVVGKTNPTGPDQIDASTSPRLLRIGDPGREPAAALTVKGSPLNDVITLAAGAGIPFDSSVDGGDGNDVVNGSSRRDVIHGGLGADSINGLGGSDDLFGDAGADALTGSTGGDVLDGGADRDSVHYEDHAAGVTVTDGAGAGDDGNGTDGAAGSRDTVSNVEDLIGTAADDSLSGDASANTLTGGGGNDVLAGGAGNDTLDGGAGANTASYADHAAPVTVNLVTATGGAAGEQDALVSIRDLVGGTGDDTLVGDAQANAIHGGAGKDIVIGQSGGDFLFGETGDDDMRAKDDETDNVDCGDGADKASLDDIDLAVACDDSTITVVDIDGDGAPHALDCDDSNAAIHPGAVDVPGDGIDQDCAGGDARVDADGDGIFREQDCDDANPAIRPGAVEINGNAVDENCDGIRAPFPKLDVGLGQDYRYFDTYTLLTELSAARVPAGATIVVRCGGKGKTGCPFKARTVKVRAAKKKVSFKKAFKGRHLRAGTTVTLIVRAPGAIGKALVIKVRSPKKPSTKITCVDPAGKTVAC